MLLNFLNTLLQCLTDPQLKAGQQGESQNLAQMDRQVFDLGKMIHAT